MRALATCSRPWKPLHVVSGNVGTCIRRFQPSASSLTNPSSNIWLACMSTINTYDVVTPRTMFPTYPSAGLPVTASQAHAVGQLDVIGRLNEPTNRAVVFLRDEYARL